ncbi:MAG: hypothetical protein JWR90_3024 [Marmoricola sp.]|jgi:hypothetical protein|nr:hypothetical protein [Marmoricola sp.]
MTGFLIALAVFLVIVIAVGVRYDRRQRGMNASSGGPGYTKTRQQNQYRADQWGGPGGGQ